MIEARELRIGNKVDLYGSIATIETVDFAGIGIAIKEGKPIPLTEEWLLKFGFENWGYGSLYSNEHEKYTRYVLHNILDGTSNFEIHFIESNYGNILNNEYVISCDEDDRINWGVELKNVHQLQNLYFALTNEELTLNN